MGILLKLCALLMTVVFAAESAMFSAVRTTQRDPLAPYAAILPGQSIAALKNYRCSLEVEMRDGIESGSCHFTPGGEMFSQITVVVANRIIIQTDFAVIPYRFSLGESILCWGEPFYISHDYPETGTSLNLYWDNQIRARISPTADRARPNYFLPITYLSINRAWKPVEYGLLTCASGQ